MHSCSPLLLLLWRIFCIFLSSQAGTKGKNITSNHLSFSGKNFYLHLTCPDQFLLELLPTWLSLRSSLLTGSPNIWAMPSYSSFQQGSPPCFGSLLGRHSTPSDCTDGKEQAAVPHPKKKPHSLGFILFCRREDQSKFHPIFSSLQLQNPASTGKPLSLGGSAPLDLARKHWSG